MEQDFTIQKVLTYRKLTRAIGDIVLNQMRAYVVTLAPLFGQRAVFGEHIQDNGKELVKTADQAFKELQTLYETVATAAPFHLPKELKSPLMQMTSSLELLPWEYVHVAKTDHVTKNIAVTSPFKAVLTYSGYSPYRMKELLSDRNRNNGALEQAVLHYLAMQVVITNKPGLAKMLETLRFPIATTHVPGLGKLPVTFISSAISTQLPPDEVVIESTEFSGKDAFEELVNVSDVESLRDPYKERLMELIRSQ